MKQVDPNATFALVKKSHILHRDLSIQPLRIVRASGSHVYLEDGKKILDSTTGAAVACIGHGNERVRKAMYDQMGQVSYIHAQIYTSGPAEELAQLLIDSTDHKMSHAIFMSSGSEAMEAALKLSRQFFLEIKPPQPQRQIFISRKQSYHGATIGALSVSGHVTRRANYEPILLQNTRRVSPCNAYRFQALHEDDASYSKRLATELEDEILAAGADRVCAFVAETIVGAATGCVPPVTGYFKAIRKVCDKYGVLLVLDEIMCGNGRCGSMHAWQQEDVVPDIQTMGKGLGGGYQPLSAVLLNHRVHGVLQDGTGAFAHGQTYQSHVLACCAALEVQRIIKEERLVRRCRDMGDYLWRQLQIRIGKNPNVGNIRGRGLFWGIEFVKDKSTKEPFPPSRAIANIVHSQALVKGVALYPGTGTVDGILGDHVLVAPPYNVSIEEVDELIKVFGEVVDEVFATHTLQAPQPCE